MLPWSRTLFLEYKHSMNHDGTCFAQYYIPSTWTLPSHQSDIVGGKKNRTEGVGGGAKADIGLLANNCNISASNY